MRETIEQLLTSAIQAAIDCKELPVDDSLDAAIERPKDTAHGDWASSYAMRCAKKAHMNPREIAEIIVGHIGDNPNVERVEIAGPGFINITLSNAALQGVFRDVREQDLDYGRTHEGDGVKVDLEFISANPTGPMHLGHGRWAALGDAMANVLAFAGYEVTREFYINDAGNQMDIFAESVGLRYLQIARLIGSGKAVDVQLAKAEIIADMETYRRELPENCYAGAYIIDIAGMIYDAEGDGWVEADCELPCTKHMGDKFEKVKNG